ncbi:putative vacuolar protein sorting protein [Suhomyces tanzawaensis NRRL Y-17324]|uniref:Vacuolar protein-sorting-associated protein 36 n=1 Tax=Suhomyces tanzawaensis NRRL Y-17324 TaxID=984487 RepID=A0A1E4SK34_9ASCO|nr:putative vacuolar protein sorting protein [Suhomyces tanzawaensis NRRL Y-17324]ODV79792.1 putative vacuolar protein sorting protein [Suhomyces tanzawaensis NRRL Y-17324]
MTSHLNIWKPILINRSNRPILVENEHNLYIRDNIGLYQGKLKILHRQNGRVYLTNKRIIYFDNTNGANSLALDLKDVTRSEIIDGFLRSSPKIRIMIKVSGEESAQISNKRLVWTCKICSFNNQIALNFDLENNSLPKCTSCGITANMGQLRKVLEEFGSADEESGTSSIEQTPEPDRRDDQCPTCTFINHPSMTNCELCGTELKSTIPKTLKNKISSQVSSGYNSPTNGINIKLENDLEQYTNGKPYVKLSFRKGGESKFQELLIQALDEIKWEALKQKGAINQNGTKLETPAKQPQKQLGGGIFGLEKIGEQQRKTNEIILRDSVDDLEQLMFRFQDLMKLSTSFTKFINGKKSSEVIIPPLAISKTSSLYHQELSRHISEYLVSFELTKRSSVVTSQDLYAKYNRYLVLTQGFGTELISPLDLNRALELFDELNLPVISKKYEKSGLVVLSSRSSHVNTYEEFILKFIQEKEDQFRFEKVKVEVMGISNGFVNSEYAYFKGVTISEISDKFGWSYNITQEEIETCVENGTIVLDHNISGTFYFNNRFTNADEEDHTEELRARVHKQILDEQNVISSSLKTEYQTSQNLINLGPSYEFGVVETSHQESTTEPPVRRSSVLHALEGLEFN